MINVENNIATGLPDEHDDLEHLLDQFHKEEIIEIHQVVIKFDQLAIRFQSVAESWEVFQKKIKTDS